MLVFLDQLWFFFVLSLNHAFLLIVKLLSLFFQTCLSDLLLSHDRFDDLLFVDFSQIWNFAFVFCLCLKDFYFHVLELLFEAVDCLVEFFLLLSEFSFFFVH